MPLPNGAQLPIHPQPLAERGQIDQRPSSARGLTLLDALAIAALPVAQTRVSFAHADYAGRPPRIDHGRVEEVAAQAYELAEAMLVERARRLQPE